ncbi:peptidyl-prolyl cis-trans isomerase-like 2 like protein [Zymoseptoria brevis]|uniref:Peptidyl-prolyl cis-trans isomerase-like 2 n=1 Tax=Zymoseptoria brevis TaxID=1047168 RepID=A0A0F4GG33_9PEZI|nr:peptidyl-prolyl cis-trans isomerase-like 2 like protein [Zymoseptoria brevis]
MGKGTDKLYITHSEWSSEDAFGANAGAKARKNASNSLAGASFKRLPFNFCALSLQPFEHPVCTADGTIFDLTNILPWLKKHGTNPVTGTPLKSSELIKLHFTKNEDNEFTDPVTFKPITDNTHLLALRNTGNVFSYDTVERLNIKAKNWRDLVTDEEFKRSDIITLQDPQNVESRDLSKFKYIQEGADTLTATQQAERAPGVNDQNLGSAAKILKAKEAVAKARAEREAKTSGQASSSTSLQQSRKPAQSSSAKTTKPAAYNAAQHSTGAAAASFTSTGLTPTTSTALTTLSDEEYLLKPRRVRAPAHVRLATSHGSLHFELYPEFAPKAVWNFLTLARRGAYNGVSFHRNIPNFMIQGGDPTGTGRGGSSCWGKSFADEFEGPKVCDKRGVVAMANKGKDTNTSQFFILYRAARHLDRKHTVFGIVVGGWETLDKLEKVESDDKGRPLGDGCTIEEVSVLVDPFEDFLKERDEKEKEEERKEKLRREGGAEDERVTWTGKRLREDGKPGDGGASGVGKYLKSAAANGKVQAEEEDEILEEVPMEEWEGGAKSAASALPAKKKAKMGGGFGDFSGW